MEVMDMIELMKAVSENGLTSFEMEKGDVKIVMKREKKVVEVPVAGGQTVALGVPVAAACGQAAVLGCPGVAVGNPAAVYGAQAMAAGVPVTAGGSAAVLEGQGGPAANGNPAAAGPGIAASCGAPGEPTPDNVVTCPLVGTFYSSPSPDADDFVKVGDHVKKGQVIGIVEAILVKNEETVEYGQPLFRIR